MPRTTAEVADCATIAYLLGEAVQEVSIERLLRELTVEVLNVGGRD
jgi:hypothetical protein